MKNRLKFLIFPCAAILCFAASLAHADTNYGHWFAVYSANLGEDYPTSPITGTNYTGDYIDAQNGTSISGRIQFDMYDSNQPSLPVLDCPAMATTAVGAGIKAYMSDTSAMLGAECTLDGTWSSNPVTPTTTSFVFIGMQPGTVACASLSLSACESAGSGSTNYEQFTITYPPLTPPAPLFAFVYPTSSSYVYPYFDNIIMNFGNLTSTDQYLVNLSLQARYPSGALGPLIVDQPVQESGAQLLAYGLSMPSIVLAGEGIVNASSTATVMMTSTLADITNFVIPDNLNNFIVNSSSLTFTEYNGDYIGGTVQHVLPDYFNASGTAIGYTLAATSSISVFINNSTTNAEFSGPCLPASSTFFIGQDIFFAGCSLANFLFVPPANTWTGLQSAFTGLEQTPFLAGFFGEVNDAQILANSYTSPSAWTMPTILGIGATTTVITLVPATENLVGYVNNVLPDGNTFANTLFNLILDAAVLGYIYLAIICVSWVIRIISK